MKTIILLTLTLLVTYIIPTLAQENLAAKDIAVHLDAKTGKIELLHRENKTNITANYHLSKLELTIFDANGEYAGTLSLEELLLPQKEIDATEQVKVAVMELRHTSSGQELTLANVNFEP